MATSNRFDFLITVLKLHPIYKQGRVARGISISDETADEHPAFKHAQTVSCCVARRAAASLGVF
jgi:hypothetical protein